MRDDQESPFHLRASFPQTRVQRVEPPSPSRPLPRTPREPASLNRRPESATPCHHEWGSNFYNNGQTSRTASRKSSHFLKCT